MTVVNALDLPAHVAPGLWVFQRHRQYTVLLGYSKALFFGPVERFLLGYGFLTVFALGTGDFRAFLTYGIAVKFLILLVLGLGLMKESPAHSVPSGHVGETA